MSTLEGKVVLITGAGSGIGRTQAIACARAGARVAVNEVGSAADSAAAVVEEIEATGGEALPAIASVTDPDAVRSSVEAVVARWGRLDGVVNNAGILRDRSFVKMTDDEWRSVLAVHLDGTRNVIRAALPALTVRGGRIVNTTSVSGMLGNTFGQSNYAAAKAAIYGLTRVLAVELGKHGVTVNAIAPIAKTKMTADLDRVDPAWTPECVAPLVVFLLSELARDVTGRVFGVAGPRMYAYEVRVSEGVVRDGPWTPEAIAEQLDAITRIP